MSDASQEKEVLLAKLNAHLRNHPEFVEGMSFDDIKALPNGTFLVKNNFNYGGKKTPGNFETGNRIYQEIYKDLLA